MNSLHIYYVKNEYIEFLRNFDKKVTIIKDSEKQRPYIGIVFQIKEFKYFAPFSSPEKDEKGDITENYKKYFSQSGNITYERIENLKYGIIRLNNMIPLPDSEIVCFDIDEIEDDKYKLILKDQFIYCDNNKDKILKKASKLYKMVTIYKNTHFIDISCNFKLLESRMLEYIAIKEAAATIEE